MKWALVLSGGGAKGLAYIGMLKAFEELKFPKPDCIVGCSIGAIIGGLYSSGMKVDEMLSFFNSFDINSYTDIPRFGFKQTRISKFLQIGASINNLITGHGIDSGEKMHTLLNKLLCYQKFENTDIPFYCNATDLCSGKEVVFEKGFLADAIRCSASYPIFFKPYHIDGRVYIDGCLKHNTPTWIAKKKGFKNILAITVGSLKPSEESDFNSVFSIIFRCLDIAVSQGDFELHKKNIPTHILDFDSHVHSYEFDNISEKIEFGYSEVMKHRRELELFFNNGLSGFFGRMKLHRKIVTAFKNEKFVL